MAVCKRGVSIVNWREFVLSLDATQIFIAAAGSAGAGLLWVKRRYISFGEWRKSREARRLAFNDLPSRVSEFSRLLDGVREQSEKTLGVLDAHTKTLDDQNRVLSNISAMIYGEMELDPTPRFICDSDGRNLNVNTAYARLIGCGRDELMGFGYQRFIPGDLNPGYMADFDSAEQQHRSFERTVNIRRPDGTVMRAYVRIVPHPEHEPPAHYWVGVVTAARRSTDA